MKPWLNRRQSSIASAAFVIMTTYGLSSLLGLIRNRLLASFFFGGREWQLDVYFASFVIPDTVFQLLVIGALSAAFIPVFSQYYQKSKAKGWQLASLAINAILLIFLAVSVLVFILARPLSQLIAPEYNLSQINLMVQLIRVMLVAQLFFAVSAFLTGMLQAHQRFIIPAISPILYNLGIIIGTVFLSGRLDIFGPAIGVVLGAFLHFIIQLPFAWNLGWRYQPILNFRHSGIKAMIRLMLPRTLTLAVGQIENFLAVVFTAGLTAGSLSMFKFARQLYVLPINLFGVTFAQAAFPSLSRQAAQQQLKGFKQLFCQTLRQLVFFALPASLFLLILRVPLVRLAFGVKQFPWQATLLTAKVLAALALSIVLQAASHLLIRCFYALHNTRKPLAVSLVTAGINVVLSWLLVKYFNWGVLGLAWALTLTNVFQTVGLGVLLYRQLFGFDGREFLLALIKMLLAAGLTAICLWLPMRFFDRYVLDTTRTIGLIALSLIVGLIGSGVYLIVSHWLGIEEVGTLGRLWQRLRHWRQTMTGEKGDQPTTTLTTAEIE